jgi:hypothetical protein
LQIVGIDFSLLSRAQVQALMADFQQVELDPVLSLRPAFLNMEP